MSVDVRDIEAREKWLEKQPREFVIGFAVRNALRTLPVLATLGDVSKHADDIILPLLRGMALPWVAGTYPTHGRALRDAAYAAYAADAARAAYAAARAARAAYAAARAAYAAADAAYAARAAAYTARAAEPAAYAAADAAYAAAQIDVDSGIKMNAPLWFDGDAAMPQELLQDWQRLKKKFLALDENWHVWTDWYEARLWPDKFPAPNEQLELARVTIADEDWEKGWQHINPLIQGLIEEHGPERIKSARRQQLAKMASPAPRLNNEQKLTAGPNPEIDQLQDGEDAVELGDRQLAVLATILESLPDDCPDGIKVAFEQYQGELLAKGLQPSTGKLDDMVEIINANIDEMGHNMWAEMATPQFQTALEKFRDLHNQIMQHYPLVSERTDVYDQVEINEQTATDENVNDRIKTLLDATRTAHKNEFVTDEYLRAIETMAQFARLHASVPGQTENGKPNKAKKRSLAQLFGFVEKSSKLVERATKVAKTAKEFGSNLADIANEIWNWFS